MIPDYQSLMLPLLKLLSDEQEHKLEDIREGLAKELNLSDEELKELLPSGAQPIFNNRVGWARAYLRKARLIDAPKRAVLKITPRGSDVLKQNLNKIDYQYLMQFPEFVSFVKKEESEEPSITQTPDENLETAFLKINKSLSQELLHRVIEQSPAFFENLVVELLVKMGYGGSRKDAGKAIGKSGDEGIDGTIKEDKLGLDVIYIQAKK